MILAITTGLTNARSEGYNRIVKHVGRIVFGFRNPDNQKRQIRWACTRGGPGERHPERVDSSPIK